MEKLAAETQNMRLLITGAKKTELAKTAMPKAKGRWAVVKVLAIPLCTEYKGWLSGQAYPGHEAAGEVVEVSPGCEVQIGDRVAVMPTNPCGDCELCGQGEYIHCQNNLNFEAETGLNTGGDTHVRYLAKQDWMLAKIPKSVPLELGALACCGLGPTFGACENLGVDGASTVLIAGAGPVGLGGVINAKYRGAKVICMEPVEYRRNLALSLGADLALDPNAGGFAEAVLDFTGGRGADFALEASGTSEGARLCLSLLRRRGKLAFIGENGDFSINVSNDFLRSGITVIGQWHYNRNGTEKIFEVIKNSPNVAGLITHRYPISKIDEALDICARHQCGKIIIDPWA